MKIIKNVKNVFYNYDTNYEKIKQRFLIGLNLEHLQRKVPKRVHCFPPNFEKRFGSHSSSTVVAFLKYAACAGISHSAILDYNRLEYN